MVVHPNKPVLFIVNHATYDVAKALSHFVEVAKGKKVLYIELSPEFVEDAKKSRFEHSMLDVGPYRILVQEATKLGLEVKGLDRSLVKAGLEKNPRLQTNPDSYIYDTLDKREKLWETKLHGANSRTIVVVASGHGEALAQRLGIPKSNIIVENYYTKLEMPFYISRRRKQRAESELIEAEIRSARQKRKLEESKRRLALKAKKPK